MTYFLFPSTVTVADTACTAVLCMFSKITQPLSEIPDSPGGSGDDDDAGAAVVGVGVLAELDLLLLGVIVRHIDAVVVVDDDRAHLRRSGHNQDFRHHFDVSRLFHAFENCICICFAFLGVAMLGLMNSFLAR